MIEVIKIEYILIIIVLYYVIIKPNIRKSKIVIAINLQSFYFDILEGTVLNTSYTLFLLLKLKLKLCYRISLADNVSNLINRDSRILCQLNMLIQNSLYDVVTCCQIEAL